MTPDPNRDGLPLPRPRIRHVRCGDEALRAGQDALIALAKRREANAATDKRRRAAWKAEAEQLQRVAEALLDVRNGGVLLLDPDAR